MNPTHPHSISQSEQYVRKMLDRHGFVNVVVSSREGSAAERISPSLGLRFVDNRSESEQINGTGMVRYERAPIQLSGNMVSGDQCDLSGHPNPEY